MTNSTKVVYETTQKFLELSFEIHDVPFMEHELQMG